MVSSVTVIVVKAPTALCHLVYVCQHLWHCWFFLVQRALLDMQKVSNNASILLHCNWRSMILVYNLDAIRFTFWLLDQQFNILFEIFAHNAHSMWKQCLQL